MDRNVIRPSQYPVLISFALAEDADVRIAVFNSAGEFIADLWNGPAHAHTPYQIAWWGTNYRRRPVSSNVYILRLFSPRLLLLRRLGVTR